jgi:hypothetical protein
MHDLHYRRFVTFEIELVRPSISNTFDIDIRYRRCKTSISNGHSMISKSSISNVALHIEGPTLDIGVARIQMRVLGLHREYKSTSSWPGPGPASLSVLRYHDHDWPGPGYHSDPTRRRSHTGDHDIITQAGMMIGRPGPGGVTV